MKKAACILFFTFYFFQSNAQVTFNKTYNNEIDAMFNIVETTNGYIVAEMAGFPIFPKKICIRKLDINGDTQLQKLYGDSNEYHNTYSLIRTSDGNYLTGAYNYNIDQDFFNIYLLKINNNIDSIWEKKIVALSGFNYYSNYVVEASDKGFLITGEIADTALNDGNVFILKTDSLGNELWHSSFGGNKFDVGYSSVELPDKGFLTLGWTRSFGFGSSTNHDYYLIKSDSLGNFKWQKTYGTTLNDTPIGITGTNDGNYLIAGNKEITSGTNYNGNIIKIDTAGNIIWQKNYGGTSIDELWWVHELDNGDIAAVGSKRNVNQKDEGWIIRIDSSGNQIWERSWIIGNDHSYFRDFKQTTDGGFICAGFVFEGPDGTQDAWLVKMDSLGCDSAGCATYTGIEENNPTISSNNQLHIFPNPAKDFITLDFTQMPFTVAKISVFNTLAQRVLLRKELVKDFVTVNVSKLSTGIYTVMAEYEGLRQTAKFVKQ